MSGNNQKKKGKQAKRKQNQNRNPQRQQRPNRRPRGTRQARRGIRLEDKTSSRFLPLTLDTARYIEMVINPFNSHHEQLKASDLVCRLPQNCGKDTIVLYETGAKSITVVGGANGAGILQIGAIDTVNKACGVYAYDVTASAPGTDLIDGGMAVILSSQKDSIDGILGASAKIRVTSAAVRCTVSNVNTATVGSGLLYGFHSKGGPLSAATPAYTAPADWLASLLDQDFKTRPYNLSQGVTVRTPITDESMEFKDRFANIKIGTALSGDYLPGIAWTGVSDGVTLTFEWRIYYEAIVTGNSSIESRSVIPESNWEQLQYYLNNQVPLITEGHTFKSFFTNVWNGLKKIGRTVMPTIGPLLSGTRLAPMAPVISAIGDML